MPTNFRYFSNQDVAVIGGGPGGQVAAIRAGQLGLKTVCIEGRGALGGTCLNVGCIPSKYLLEASKQYKKSKNNEFEKFGVTTTETKLDLAKVMNGKNSVIGGLTGGIAGLFKKNKVDYKIGWGSFLDKNTINIESNGSFESVTATNIIIATGSDVISLPGITIDEEYIVSSTGALDFTTVPESLAVVGGGVIGLEMASVWNNQGSKVKVIEFMDKILPPEDDEVSKEMAKIMKKKGIDIALKSKVTKATVDKVKKCVELEIEDETGKVVKETQSKVLISIGRKALTDKLNLSNAGVKTDERGRVEVSLKAESLLKTNIDNIQAIGDCIEGPMLAHKAEEDGVAAVDFIATGHGHIDYNVVPGVVYTYPEVASVGKTEQQLKKDGVKYKKGVFPFKANSRAVAVIDNDGFVKFLVDEESDEILGIHIISPQAGEMISAGVLAMQYGASSEDIGRTIFAHPTLMEAFKEAAMASYGKPIHM